MDTMLKEAKDDLIKEMAMVLKDRYYEYRTEHLKTIVDEWFTQKKDLIKVLSKHPNWNREKFMIQFDTDVERSINLVERNNFIDWLKCAANIRYDWRLYEQSREYRITNFIQSITTQFFDDSMESYINNVNALNENFKLRTNMKASKAIGKICREEGWDKLDGFNQYYARLCDALNPLKVTRHTCISVNPIDYLLMSNGNSWESCHYIGDDCDSSGCYSSGTISYMLDKHSFLFYTVDASFDGKDIELEPKIQRQVFGYNDEVLMQSRLYPQANDSGADNVYTDIREIVQKVIADCLNKPNIWTRSKDDVRDVVRKGTCATCYADWLYDNPGSEHCSVSTLKDRVSNNPRRIILGAEPICITCGDRHSYADNISCCNDYNYYEDDYDEDIA